MQPSSLNKDPHFKQHAHGFMDIIYVMFDWMQNIRILDIVLSAISGVEFMGWSLCLFIAFLY